MKHRVFFLSILTILTVLSVQSAHAKTSRFEGEGEIVTVDPVYSQVTIKHGAIKGFAGDDETLFFVSDAKMIGDLGRKDLVAFTILDENGDVKIEKIARTGRAAEEEKVGLGRVVQDVLVGTGEVAKTVTTPIAPAHEVVSGTVDATTGATGAVLEDADAQSKQQF